jgi:hypothetical protein
MAQGFKPGEIVPQSGIYTITHDPAAIGGAGVGRAVGVIRRRSFSKAELDVCVMIPPGFTEETWQVAQRFAELIGWHLDQGLI